MDCIHEKAYSNLILLTNPPQYRWVCKKCGEEGIDIQDNLFDNEYDKIILEKYKNKQ